MNEIIAHILHKYGFISDAQIPLYRDTTSRFIFGTRNAGVWGVYILLDLNPDLMSVEEKSNVDAYISHTDNSYKLALPIVDIDFEHNINLGWNNFKLPTNYMS